MLKKKTFEQNEDINDVEIEQQLDTESDKYIEVLEDGTSIMKNQICPMCRQKTLTLIENERDIAFFGKTFFFSMECSNCNYFHADLESEEYREPSKYKIIVKGGDDLNIRVVKSAKAVVKIPRMLSITPGPASNGYVTNIEGLINRVENMFKEQYDAEEDNDKKKKLKNMIKKLNRVKAGFEELEIQIEDETGNSAIISDKAVKSKL